MTQSDYCEILLWEDIEYIVNLYKEEETRGRLKGIPSDQDDELLKWARIYVQDLKDILSGG